MAEDKNSERRRLERFVTRAGDLSIDCYTENARAAAMRVLAKNEQSSGAKPKQMKKRGPAKRANAE